MNFLSPSLLSLPLAAAIACGTAPQDTDAPGAFVESALERDTNPDVSAENAAILSKGNRDFAFDLYRELSDNDDNIFFSPYSISTALAMTYGGARGETEKQMSNTLHYDLPQNKLHSGFNSLALDLDTRGQGAEGSDNKGFRLNIINAIWGAQGYEFLPDYLDLLAENYGAGLHVLDFLNEAEESRLEINQWVEEQTEDRIKDLLPKDSITPDTILVLTNAIYFNAAWSFPFEPEQTQNGTFHTLAGTDVTVPMMHSSLEIRSTEGDGYQAVELPYDGDELSMIVIIPDENTFSDINNSINGDWAAGLLDSLQPHLVELSIPKWKLESDVPLTKTLEDMGMPIAMSGAADFSGINGQGGLQITDILHKGFIEVNEAGTEAAAATAVVVGETSVPTPVSVDINRAFIYFIIDHKTEAVLFVGRVADPSV